MRIRRCSIVIFESRETVGFDLSSLLAGGTGLARTRNWVALAPHLDEPVLVGIHEIEFLGSLSAEDWIAVSEAVSAGELVNRLVSVGLVLVDHEEEHWRIRDDRVRQRRWWSLAAVAHHFGRWHDVDAVQATRDSDMERADRLLARLGSPPPVVPEYAPRERRMPLARMPQSEDNVRTTCRNFDKNKPLSFEVFSTIMQRVFAARAQVLLGAEASVLKKNVPSAGALHPIECFVLAQRVEGVIPGTYHYHPVDHALEPLGESMECLSATALHMLAGQQWFADAPVIIGLIARFERCFWKYRQHPKAYRTLVLDAGHLSQALYASATEAGLGAFVTSAINECNVEAAFGLDGLEYGPLALCGFGARGQVQTVTEFDPEGRVWSQQ